MAEQERTPKVLIVDDDPRLRDLLRRYLGDNGFSVSVADGAPAMNRIWMRERFDALILDLMLPGEDGLQILRRLRASKDMTPVLMLTARGEDVDRIVGLELGADDYIAKHVNCLHASTPYFAVDRAPTNPERLPLKKKWWCSATLNSTSADANCAKMANLCRSRRVSLQF